MLRPYILCILCNKNIAFVDVDRIYDYCNDCIMMNNNIKINKATQTMDDNYGPIKMLAPKIFKIKKLFKKKDKTINIKENNEIINMKEINNSKYLCCNKCGDTRKRKIVKRPYDTIYCNKCYMPSNCTNCDRKITPPKFRVHKMDCYCIACHKNILNVGNKFSSLINIDELFDIIIDFCGRNNCGLFKVKYPALYNIPYEQEFICYITNIDCSICHLKKEYFLNKKIYVNRFTKTEFFKDEMTMTTIDKKEYNAKNKVYTELFDFKSRTYNCGTLVCSKKCYDYYYKLMEIFVDGNPIFPIYNTDTK